MTSRTVPIRDFEPTAQTRRSWIEKQVLHRVHPQSIILELIAWTWFTYYFLAHEWVPAVMILIIARILEFMLVKAPDYEKMANTTLGKLALLHLHPANILIQLAGLGLFLYGLWMHETVVILGGISVITLGHWFGWSKVNPSLK